jgi:hypothetical protein
MSNLILLLVLVFNPGPVYELPSVSEVRSLYQKAATEEKYCKELLKRLEPCDEKSNALLFGYRGGATMMMAKYASNPFSKLSHFKKGRTMLEKAIARDQQSVELRFLRFTAQTKSPDFLGYNDQIETDKKFLLYSLTKLADTSLRKAILSYLLSSEYVNPAEKKQLKDERLIDSGG